MNAKRLSVLMRTALLVLALSALVACGGGAASSDDEPTAPAATKRAVATMPSASFAQPTTQIGVAAGSEITETADSATPEPEVAAGDLERGAGIYANKGCDECHGPNAEGVADEGSALAGTTLSLQIFTDVLRTGANGELGPDHLYGPTAVSPGGVDAIYAWLQSLDAQ